MAPTPTRIEVVLPAHGEARASSGQDFMVDAARWVALIGDEGLWLIVFVTGYGHGAEREYPYFVESPRMPAEVAPAWVPAAPPWFSEAAAQMRGERAAPVRA